MASAAINDIIEHGTGLDSALGRRFVRDFGKAAETGAYKEFRTKYQLTHADWEHVPRNAKLIRAVKTECDRRAGNGGAVDTRGSSVSNIVDLQGQPVNLADNPEFLIDLCRYYEKIMPEESVRKKWRFDNATWEKLGDDQELIRKVEEESARRVRDGSCKREKSQKLITKAPDILDAIMSDVSASPRHRVDAIKTLDSFTSNGPDDTSATDRFQIVINLGADLQLKFDKSRKPDVDDVDPNAIDTTPNVIAAIATDKKDDGGGDTL